MIMIRVGDAKLPLGSDDRRAGERVKGGLGMGQEVVLGREDVEVAQAEGGDEGRRNDRGGSVVGGSTQEVLEDYAAEVGGVWVRGGFVVV